MCFGAQTPKYGYLSPDPPKKIFYKKTKLNQTKLTNAFLTSHQPSPGDDSFTRYRGKCVLGPNFQIWLFGPRPPKNIFFQKIKKSCEKTNQYASKKPSTIIIVS